MTSVKRPTTRVAEGVWRDEVTGEYFFQAERPAPDGTRLRKTERGHKTLASAKRARREWLRTSDKGGPAVKASREFLRDYLPKWNAGRLDLRPESRRRAGYYVRDVVSVLGGVRACELQSDHVRRLLRDLIARGQGPRSVNGARGLLHACYADAVRSGEVVANPVALVPPLRVDRPTLVVPDGDGLAALQRAAEGTTWEAAVLISTTTGARRGEVLGLTWDDLDLDIGRLRITRALVRVDGQLTHASPKTPRARRAVVLPASAQERLRRWKFVQAQEMLRLGLRQTGDTFIASNPMGGPLDLDAYTKAWRRLAAAVGLEGSRLHDARHAVATQAIARGVDVGAVADVLGHADAGFTLRTYRHATENSAERVAEAMAEAIGGGS